MHRPTRRTLLRGGAIALLGGGALPAFLRRAASAEGRRPRRRVLVVVFQRGAADGLGMVAPHGDPDYYAARPSIALARPAAGRRDDALIDLDGLFGLHPALSPLAPLWASRSLAIVHACGSPDATRSHFDAQAYMETGTPGVKSTADGWLARGLSITAPPAASPFRAVALGARLPKTLSGSAGALAFESLAGFDVRGDAAGRAGGDAARPGLEALYAAGADSLVNTGRETFTAINRLRALPRASGGPEHGARYPRGAFGESLAQIAQLIRADVGLEVAFTELSGWDTHAAQGHVRGPLAQRLRELAEGLAALDRDLGDRMADVVVLTMTEFGRTVRENGTGGTDHGHGTAMLVIGGPVRGGRVLGRWPGLAPEQRFEGRDLAVTTDFRQLFAEIAVGHLGVPAAAPIFPGFPVDAAQYPGVLG